MKLDYTQTVQEGVKDWKTQALPLRYIWKKSVGELKEFLFDFPFVWFVVVQKRKKHGYNRNLFSDTEDPPPILIKTCKDRH